MRWPVSAGQGGIDENDGSLPFDLRFVIDLMLDFTVENGADMLEMVRLSFSGDTLDKPDGGIVDEFFLGVFTEPERPRFQEMGEHLASD
jgi:hypothetical protein